MQIANYCSKDKQTWTVAGYQGGHSVADLFHLKGTGIGRNLFQQECHYVDRVPFSAGMSYRKAEWVPGKELWEAKPQLLRNFLHRRTTAGTDEDEEGERSARVVNGINPDWMLVDRVIAQRGRGADLEYLVKWCSLPYSESTWEAAQHLSHHAEDKVSPTASTCHSLADGYVSA
jgi:hypothetical protein